MTLGGQLRGIRGVRGLSLAKAAEAAGISNGALSRIENDLREPTVETLTGLARALGVTFTIDRDGISLAITLGADVVTS